MNLIPVGNKLGRLGGQIGFFFWHRPIIPTENLNISFGCISCELMDGGQVDGSVCTGRIFIIIDTKSK